MDIRLSGDRDGIDTLNEIQKIRAIPTIFMSGYGDTNSKQQAHQLNPLAYLIKPVTAGDIKNVIEGRLPFVPGYQVG